MSKVKNEPKIKNPLIAAIREQLEHRALWMYLLCDEAAKKGLNAEDYAPAAPSAAVGCTKAGCCGKRPEAGRP